MTNPNSANTIDEVIDRLNEIINESEAASSPMGYFAALYQNVTVAVKNGIAEGYFEDGPRMEKLDVIFANRYLSAYHEFNANREVTASWQTAFEASSNQKLIVLQHLLVGMNAHINLDLGIAAAEVSEGQNIHDLKEDFRRINEILSGLVSKVQNDLCEVWPALKLLLRFTRKADDYFIDFSMELARNGAWKFAVRLANEPKGSWGQFIGARDRKVANKDSLIIPKGFFLRSLLRVIRLTERGDVTQKIQWLTK